MPIDENSRREASLSVSLSVCVCFDSSTMAANFWASSHYKQLLDQEDVDVVHSPDKEKGITLEEFKLVKMHMANYILRLAQVVKVRQRVIATAVAYMRRVYTRKSLSEYDPRLVAPTCLYLASKAEESTVQARPLVFYIKKQCSDEKYRFEIKDILEMEMKILEALDYYLVVYHPYRPLSLYTASQKFSNVEILGKIGCHTLDMFIFYAIVVALWLRKNDVHVPSSFMHPTDFNDSVENVGTKYLFLQDAGLADMTQLAWGLVNDTYKMDLLLVHPPYMIALACIYIGSVLKEKDTTSWFEELRVDMNVVKNISMEILDFYDNNKGITEDRVNATLNKLALKQ
ncbi:hypothetical protein Sjap_009010 [Stephania japonica]|uniref:Cyclin-like domain-containing protein n=1 Tax=Stephania japonica TaxID=461633 RepID=A0AAP0PF09_9MAGN